MVRGAWCMMVRKKGGGGGEAHAKSLYLLPVPPSCRENPRGVVDDSATPMSVEEVPAAGPSEAVKTPSYESSCTTLPLQTCRPRQHRVCWSPLNVHSNTATCND